MASENETKLHSVLKETVDLHKVPGATLLVQFEDGSMFKECYGNGKLDAVYPVKMETDMQFRIGSVSKTMIGTAILMLIKEGKINFSQTLEELLPNTMLHGNEITLEMLLNQSSAIPNYTAYDQFGDIYYENPTYPWTKEEIISIVKNEDLLDSVGHTSYYSNSNYYLLGMIIEKYSGQSLDVFLRDKIFIPLNMNKTYFPTENDLTGNFAHGYLDYNQDGIFTADEDYSSQCPTAIWATGGVVSTVDDLLIWINELLTGSLLNSELQTKRMQIDVPLAGAPEGVYYGLAIADLFGAIGHTGAVAGYSTILFKYKNTIIISYGNGYETNGENPLIAEDIFEKVKAALF